MNWDKANYGEASKAIFVVQAAELWNPSSALLVKGGKYEIIVPEKRFRSPGIPGDVDQRWNDTHVTVGANGYASHYDAVSKCHVAHGRCRAGLKLPRRVPSENWLKLMCAIGDFQWQVAPVLDGVDLLMPKVNRK